MSKYSFRPTYTPSKIRPEHYSRLIPTNDANGNFYYKSVCYWCFMSSCPGGAKCHRPDHPSKKYITVVDKNIGNRADVEPLEQSSQDSQPKHRGNAKRKITNNESYDRSDVKVPKKNSFLELCDSVRKEKIANYIS